MKNTLYLFLVLAFGVVGCTDPYSFNEKGERLSIVENSDGGNKENGGGNDNSGGTTDSTSTPNPDFLQLITSEIGIVLSVHQDSTFEFANFEAEVNYNDTKIELSDITTGIQHGIFVWNPDYIGYTDSGLKRAKFAFASAYNIEDKELVTLHLTVNENSEVCLVDVLYHNIDYKDICITITKE